MKVKVNCLYYIQKDGRCNHPHRDKWWKLRFPKCVLTEHRNNSCDIKVKIC